MGGQHDGVFSFWQPAYCFHMTFTFHMYCCSWQINSVYLSQYPAQTFVPEQNYSEIRFEGNTFQKPKQTD